MSYKYAILVGDGMADFPVSELGNITPWLMPKPQHGHGCH